MNLHGLENLFTARRDMAHRGLSPSSLRKLVVVGVSVQSTYALYKKPYSVWDPSVLMLAALACWLAPLMAQCALAAPRFRVLL